MLVTPKLIYLQLQKTGCTHIETLIKQVSSEVTPYGKHFRMPADFDTGQRIILGSIRNPWEWYLSYWSYSAMGKGGPYLRSIQKPSLIRPILDPRLKNSQGALKRTPFQLAHTIAAEFSRPAAQWRQVYNNNDPACFREWLKLALDSSRRFDLFQDYGHSSVSSFAGLLTYLYLFLYTRNGQLLFNNSLHNWQDLQQLDKRENIADAIIRTEFLEADFFDALEKAGYRFDNDDKQNLKNVKKQNTSQRLFSLTDYYDEESKELVAHKDEFIITKYSYTFPTKSLSP